MKNIFLTIVFSIFFFVSCKAQIIDLDDRGKSEAGVYYKDINHNLDIYEGTYLYVNGTTSLEIVLQKKIASNRNNVYTEDILVGAYRYVENGVEKINTLNTLNTVYDDGWLYTLNGNGIRTGKWTCPDCGATEKWIRATIEDPVSGNVHSIYLRRNFPQAYGEETMMVYINLGVSLGAVEENAPPQPQSLLPVGQWITLIKQ